MTITLTAGSWLIPVTMTLLSVGWAAFMSREQGNDQYGAGGIIAGLFWLIAIVASLASWLIWALAA